MNQVGNYVGFDWFLRSPILDWPAHRIGPGPGSAQIFGHQGLYF